MKLAPPFRWFDAFVDRGWLRCLPPSSLRLVWAIGRYIDGKMLRTRASAGRLAAEAGLSGATYFRAQAELCSRGIIRIKDEGGRRYFVLVSPPPDAKSTRRTESTRSQAREPRLSAMRVSRRRKGHQVRLPDDDQQKTNTQLGKKTIGALARVLAELCGEVPEGVSPVEVVEKLLVSAAFVGENPEAFHHEAIALQVGLKIVRWPLEILQVRDVLAAAVAILDRRESESSGVDPFVEAALSRFGGEVVAVRSVAAE